MLCPEPWPWAWPPRTPVRHPLRCIQRTGAGFHLTFSSAAGWRWRGCSLIWVSTFLHETCHSHSWGTLPPTFPPVPDHGGRGREGRRNRCAQVPEQAGDSAGLPDTWESHPPVARGKGSQVEQPEPHTPATLLLRTWSLVSMTEPRTHEGTCVMVSPPLPPCSSGPSSSSAVTCIP